MFRQCNYFFGFSVGLHFHVGQSSMRSNTSFFVSFSPTQLPFFSSSTHVYLTTPEVCMSVCVWLQYLKTRSCVWDTRYVQYKLITTTTCTGQQRVHHNCNVNRSSSYVLIPASLNFKHRGEPLCAAVVTEPLGSVDWVLQPVCICRGLIIAGHFLSFRKKTATSINTGQTNCR